MTKPGEPKIAVNPSLEERARLNEWFEVEEEAGSDFVVLRHMSRESKPPFVVRVPDGAHEVEIDAIRQQLAVAVEESEFKVVMMPAHWDFITGTLRLPRRDLCTLADHCAAYLWKPEDDELEANQAEADALAGAAEAQAAQEAEQRYEAAKDRLRE